jgi:serine/threonine protein kinase
MHGDIKPKNIMRVGHRMKLIDLDASALFDVGFSGAKFSSAYAPPELIYYEEIDVYKNAKDRAGLSLFHSDHLTDLFTPLTSTSNLMLLKYEYF